MAEEIGVPLSMLPTQLCFEDAQFSHAERLPDATAVRLIFRRLAVFADARRKKRKTRRYLVLTVRNCGVKSASVNEDEKGSPLASSEDCRPNSHTEVCGLDEDGRLLGGEVSAVDKINGRPIYRIRLLGMCGGGTNASRATLVGHVTIGQLSMDEFAAKWAKHRRECGPTAGQRHWRNIVDKVLEDNFSRTLMLLLPES